MSTWGHPHRAARHCRLTEHERIGGLAHLSVAAPRHHEQLALGCGGIIGDGQRRPIDGQQFQLHRQLRGRTHDHGIAVGRQIGERGKACAPIIGQRTEPRGHDAGAFERRVIGRWREHERQTQAAHVAPIEKRRGNEREIVRQPDRHRIEDDLAFRTHVGPQCRVFRILAVIDRVVGDELNANLVVVGEKARIEHDVLRDHLPRMLAIERYRRHRLAIDRDLEMGERKDERRRVAVAQTQLRRGHDPVEPHTHVHGARILQTSQAQRPVRTERGKRKRNGRSRRRHRGNGRGGRRCGLDQSGVHRACKCGERENERYDRFH